MDRIHPHKPTPIGPQINPAQGEVGYRHHVYFKATRNAGKLSPRFWIDRGGNLPTDHPPSVHVSSQFENRSDRTLVLGPNRLSLAANVRLAEAASAFGSIETIAGAFKVVPCISCNDKTVWRGKLVLQSERRRRDYCLLRVDRLD